MPQVWLYHVNPKSPYQYTYGWDVEHPETILRSRDRTGWGLGQMFNQVAVDDVICVFMKNMDGKPDGGYVVGKVTRTAPEEKKFSWQPDSRRSARTLVCPILRDTIEKFFPRSYGDSMQRCDTAKQPRWLALLGHGEVTDSVPRMKARGRPRTTNPTPADPEVSRAHGRRGERHVLSILRERHQADRSARVIHVSAKNPGADHDIAVMKNDRIVRLVEVKTRVGNPGDPVLISEREIVCRRAHRRRHSIFVVYLGSESTIRGVVEIGSVDAFVLKPQQHWLFPGIR